MEPVTEFTLPIDNTWTKVIENLDKEDGEGNAYHYFVVEENAEASTQYVLSTETAGEGAETSTRDVWTVKN